MFRFIGFVAGIAFQFVMGVKDIKALLALGILNVLLIFLTLFFRLLARCSVNFQVTFAEYLEDQFLKISDCCCGMTIMPQTTYRTTTYWSDGTKTTQTSKTCNTCIVGILEALIFFGLSFISPILIIFILGLYILTITRICKHYGQQKFQEALAKLAAQGRQVKLSNSKLAKIYPQGIPNTIPVQALQPVMIQPQQPQYYMTYNQQIPVQSNSIQNQSAVQNLFYNTPYVDQNVSNQNIVTG